MATAQQPQHLLSHTNVLVRETKAEVQALRGQTDLRFDQLDASFASLKDRLNALSQQLEKRDTQMEVNLTQIRTGLTSLLTTLTDKVRNPILQSVSTVSDSVSAVRDIANTIRGKVNSFDLHIVHPIQAAVTHSEEMIMGRIGEVHQAFLTMFPGQLTHVFTASEGRITDLITDRLEQATSDHKNIVTAAQSAILQATAQHANAIRKARDDLVQEMNRPRPEVTLLQNTCTAIEANTSEISDELSATRREIRAGHANNAARLYNKFASCCTDRISQFRGIDNERIRELPRSYSELYEMKGAHETPLPDSNVNVQARHLIIILIGQAKTILERLGLDTGGNPSTRTQRLKLYLGLRK